MAERETACCFTGYRPQKFPFPLKEDNKDYITFENQLTAAIFSMPARGITTFYGGMAMGFDIIAAETVLLLKRSPIGEKVKFIAAVPFPGQAVQFPSDWKRRYDEVLQAADEVVTLCPGYQSDCFQKRNRYMVDHSSVVITWFDGNPGGTANTLRYAKGRGVEVLNLFDRKPVGTKGYEFKIQSPKPLILKKRGDKHGKTHHFMAIKKRIFPRRKGDD